MKQKQRYNPIKTNILTLQTYGNVEDLNICCYLKLPFQKPPLKILCYKNIATNDDYIISYCVLNQTEFTDKCIMWYLYSKTKDVRGSEELWFEYSR